MIPQGYPLFGIDENGNIGAIIGWIPDRDLPQVLRPVGIGIEDHAEVGAVASPGNDPVRYFASLKAAQEWT